MNAVRTGAGLKRYVKRITEEGWSTSATVIVRRLFAPAKRMALRRRYVRPEGNSPGAAWRDLSQCGGTTGPAKDVLPATGRFFRSIEDDSVDDLVKSNYSEEWAATLAVVDQICRHDFSWYVPGCSQFGREVGWQVCPTTGQKWPQDIYLDIDCTGDQSRGDVRLLWELNRHQYFTALGRAWRVSGDHRYADELLSLAMDWADRNPVGFGVNWVDTQEVALRLMAWSWACFLCSNYPGFKDGTRERFLGVLAQHADFICRNLSDKLVTNNHLITESAGLATAGILFPSFRDAPRWRAKGLRIFEREVLKQVWEDGFHSELATGYHCFVLDSCLHLVILMTRNGLPVARALQERLERMIEVVMHIMRPDGSIPRIGDCDGGRAMRLTEYAPESRRVYLAVGAVLYRRSDFKQVAGSFPEDAFWLLGREGLTDFERLPAKPPCETTRFFSSAGLLSARDCWGPQAEHLLFRGGPLALRRNVSASHNHADLLSFELCKGARRVFIDPGVYLYGDRADWRHYYRSTRAHNTCVIDGCDQFDVESERFAVNGLRESTLHQVKLDENLVYIDMEYHRYAEPGIQHRRAFLYVRKSFIIILDGFVGSGSHDVELFFHLASGSACRIVGETNGHPQAVIDSEISIRHFGTTVLEMEVVCGSVDGTLQGWASDHYGQQEPAPVVRSYLTTTLPVTVGTLISLSATVELVSAHCRGDASWDVVVVAGRVRYDIGIDKSRGVRIASDGPPGDVDR